MSGAVDVLDQAMPIPEAGCWLWTGTVNERGYGRVYSDGRMWQAHRLSWMQANGAIPANTFVCHRCDTPSCVNPNHLFLGSPRDNVIDMAAKGRHHEQKKTHCPKGHAFAGDNLRVNNRGERVCLACKRGINRNHMRAVRANIRIAP